MAICSIITTLKPALAEPCLAATSLIKTYYVRKIAAPNEGPTTIWQTFLCQTELQLLGIVIRETVSFSVHLVTA